VIGLDPYTATMNAIASVNQLIVALINKANPADVEALIAVHTARLQRLHQIADFLGGALFHLPPPPAQS